VVKIIFIVLMAIFTFLEAKETQVYESQPNVLFKYKSLTKKEQNLALRVEFNNAVLYLEQKKYFKAIKLFKKTAKILKIPSFLNIGIAYYKLNSTNNAYLYLKKIYDIKEVASEDVYSYISASYYLYLLTNDRKYISTILNVANNTPKEKLTGNVKRLLVDTYILLKQYKDAILIAKNIKGYNQLKLALLYIKVRNYTLADIYLQKVSVANTDDQKINQILWFQIFRDLKANEIVKLEDHINILVERKKIFHSNIDMPLKIFFNKHRYTTKEYFDRVVHFDQDRKIDMIFYFAPFIFIDKTQINTDSSLGFVLKDKQNIQSLDMMVKYNKNFLKFVKQDPIIRVQKLQQDIDKNINTKSYEYYNLALCYAQIYDFRNAYKYFKKSYDLNHANKLYSSMTLISALRANIKIDAKTKKKIKSNLIAKNGIYDYLGKYIYRVVYSPKYKLDKIAISYTARKSIFLRALSFIENVNQKGILDNEPLLNADTKDPLVFLFKSLAKKENENRYRYIARLQDNIPKTYNNDFLKGPLIITQYYIDLLKGLGIFNMVDFYIKGEKSPTYLRTKALVQLYDGYPKESIDILETLQEKYNLNDKYTSYLLIAAFLSSGDYSNASATLDILQFENKDSDAKFLNGIELLQNLKLYTARESFREKYHGRLIDFKLEGFDQFLESL